MIENGGNQRQERGETTSRIPVLIVLILVVLSAGGALYLKQKAEVRPSPEQTDDHLVEEVDVVKAERSSVPIMLSARGFLSGFQEVMIYSEVNGRVLEIVEPGREIPKGKTVCRVDDTFYAIGVKRAKANLETAKGQKEEAIAAVRASEAAVQEAVATQENAEIEYERCLKLHESRDAVQIELDRYRSQYEMANATLDRANASLAGTKQRLATAEASIEVAQATASEAQEQLDRCTIQSPINGCIDRKYIDAGEYLVAGAPVVEVIELDRMKMTVEVTGSELSLINEASEIVVRVDAVPGTSYVARLDHVAPKADPTTRKFVVELHIDNPGHHLLSGMFGEARITCQTLQDVLMVHKDSIVNRFGGEFLFCVEKREEGMVATLKPVQTEPIPGHPQSRNIVGGVEPGDLIVPAPPSRLVDGAPVKLRRP